jgi:Tfp pilus assembly protein PilO
METKSTKKNDWGSMVKFAVFCVTCVLTVTIWYFGHQDDITEKIESKYVTKTELELVSQKLTTVEVSLKEVKIEFTDKLNELEETNNEIADLITDIRLTLAGISQ